MRIKNLFTVVVLLSALLGVWQVGPTSAGEPPPPPEPGSITVHKFDDANRNGQQDDGEEDLAGWPMRIYRWDEGHNPVLVAEGETGGSGKVTFGDLEPGRYKAWEADRECWEPSVPGHHWDGGYYQVVNLEKLAVLYPTGGDVTVADLVAKGAVRKNEKVKVLGSGDIAVSLNVAVDKVSESAQQKVVAAGGSVN